MIETIGHVQNVKVDYKELITLVEGVWVDNSTAYITHQICLETTKYV